MKTIIAGSREINSILFVREAVEAAGFEISEVVSGTARGVDRLGEVWATENNIPVVHFPANWTALGKAAGAVRNQEMADYADALIAVWDGVSRGTKDMINRAKKNGLRVYVHIV